LDREEGAIAVIVEGLLEAAELLQEDDIGTNES
jgi:hypothetical protein